MTLSQNGYGHTKIHAICILYTYYTHTIYIYTYLYMSIHIYTYLYISIHISTYLYISIHIYTHLYMSMYPCSCFPLLLKRCMRDHRRREMWLCGYVFSWRSSRGLTANTERIAPTRPVRNDKLRVVGIFCWPLYIYMFMHIFYISLFSEFLEPSLRAENKWYYF